MAYHHTDKQIAVDGQSTSNGVIVNHRSDKTINNDIGLWVLAGCPSDYEALVKLKHNDKCEIEPDCVALLIKEGKVFGVGVSDGLCSHTEYKYNYTLGSGCDFATAAMDFGKSAKQAVEYAMTRDIYTGGKIQVIDVETGEVIS